jgi:nitrogen fixation NifU-like protein
VTEGELTQVTGSLEQLYQQLILDHSKQRHGCGLSEHFDGESFQINPTCGDQVRLRVSMSPDAGEGTVHEVSWDGHGCSISQASISVMTDLVVGKSATDVEHISQAFHDLMMSHGEPLEESDEELLDDAIAFAGVARYPARVKCALLGWMALKDAMLKAGLVHDTGVVRSAQSRDGGEGPGTVKKQRDKQGSDAPDHHRTASKDWGMTNE